MRRLCNLAINVAGMLREKTVHQTPLPSITNIIITIISTSPPPSSSSPPPQHVLAQRGSGDDVVLLSTRTPPDDDDAAASAARCNHVRRDTPRCRFAHWSNARGVTRTSETRGTHAAKAEQQQQEQDNEAMEIVGTD
ncbi:unnamed protein product [Lampetra planeri]